MIDWKMLTITLKPRAIFTRNGAKNFFYEKTSEWELKCKNYKFIFNIFNF